MSGHSKWATIRRAKEITDAKRGNIFTKLARAITVAARAGGDPTMNANLRLAINKAREANMPKDNIERAVKKGTGEEKGEVLEEILYEGFGPGGFGIMVSTVTDNKNRTASDLRHLFSKHGGSLGTVNSVAWQFDRKGHFNVTCKHDDENELAFIDSGVEDFEATDNGYVCFTSPEKIHEVTGQLEVVDFKVSDINVSFIPKETVKIKAHGQKLIEELEASDDVVAVTTNAEMLSG